METLGLSEETTEERGLQTANGVADAHIGQLENLQIGNEIIRNVEVAFVDDELLGNVKLLGMNVLTRFRFTLDNQNQTITLVRTQ